MNNITLSLFDFLNFEVIGYLMLRICNFAPCQDGDWFFYVIAYIVGLVIVKLNEKTPWTQAVRNNKYFIEKGKDNLNKTKDNEYYRQYYHVIHGKNSNTISILEAQFAFIWNLLIVVIVYFVTFLVRGGSLFDTINGETLACCNGACCCVDGVSLDPLFYSISILMFFRAFGFVLDLKGITICQNKCRIVLFVLVELVLLIIIVLYYMLSKGKTYCQIGLLLALALIIFILPIIAFSIQSKISELIIEKDHFLTEMENDKKTETNE